MITIVSSGRSFRNVLLAFAFISAAALPLAAFAQEVPSYAQQPAPYAAADQDQQLRGRVVAFDGAYALSVRDENGYVDNVQLHEGTIINPTGLTLAPGMVVSILGYNAGPYFAANEIDTPYVFSAGVPYYEGHPWFYYGPTISFGFFFGNTGWWHGGYFVGGYHYAGGVRVYNNVQVRNIYAEHAGTFRGRDYVAPRAYGGYHAAHARGPHGPG
jgi:hypothetical protein